MALEKNSGPFWIALILTLLLAERVAISVHAVEPAPQQHPQPLYLSAHPSLFTVPDASRAFEQDVYPAPEILPPEAYESPGAVSESGKNGADSSRLQLIQYPTIDSAARDEEPVGHAETPRWNLFPFLTEQLAALPKDERGLIAKEVSVTDTVLPQAGGDFGMNTLDVRSTMYFGELPVLTFTPRFGWHVISAGGPVGLPSQLYDGGLDVSLYLPLTQKWSFLGMVGPSFFTDGQNTTGDAFRMTGRALAFYKWSETTKIAGGFLYLGRADIKALPAGGIFYNPNVDTKVELFFPRPRYAYRFRHEGEIEHWVYLAGEFGGNSWAVQNAPGVNDMVTLRDYRLLAGWERIAGKDWRCLVETGFVFGRRVEYTSGRSDTTQAPTGIIRAGLTF